MKWKSIGIIEHMLHRYLLNTIYSPWTFGGPGNVWKGFNVTFFPFIQCFNFKVVYFLRTQSQCLRRCVDVPFSWWSCIATGHDLVIQWPTFSAKAKNARLGFGVSILGRTKAFLGQAFTTWHWLKWRIGMGIPYQYEFQPTFKDLEVVR